ncbi:MAG: PaaI family thioesterase [Planctomycetota bacterium]|nr:PaaI family thioesterase [Planctomycetota bacterium]MDA1211398.1 PaaI family thioesterase [Planctomycetota bacterium]
MNIHNESHDDFSRGIPIRRQVPLLDHLCIRPILIAHGEAEFEITVDDPHLRTLGLLHGGVVATLLDTAMGSAAFSLVSTDQHVVTVQLNVNFIRAAEKGDVLIAKGHVRHGGRKTIVSAGEVLNANDELIAMGTATFMVLPAPKK